MVESIYLKDKMTLVFEPLGKKLRLIVSSADVELACRKETLKNLDIFIKTEEIDIFKGRLQLKKHGAEIDIIVKNKIVQRIRTSEFSTTLARAVNLS
ncbi:MAG: hypothetical protein V4541_13390 [Bacteroidota bacterium]